MLCESRHKWRMNGKWNKKIVSLSKINLLKAIGSLGQHEVIGSS